MRLGERMFGKLRLNLSIRVRQPAVRDCSLKGLISGYPALHSFVPPHLVVAIFTLVATVRVPRCHCAPTTDYQCQCTTNYLTGVAVLSDPSP